MVGTSDDEDDKSLEDSVDEDALEDAPLGVQTTINKLLKSRSQLRLHSKSLKMKLKKAQAWCEELRLQIEELNAKLADKSNKKCEKCLKFKKQAKALKVELKSRDVETDVKDTQTTEEDLRQAAWIFQYKQNNIPRLNDDSTTNGLSLAESIRETAENALIQQGMVLEETSGLYYDYKSGYYYDAEKSLYYDGNTGNYLKYDQDTKEYVVESSLPAEEVAAQRELKARKEQMKLHTVKKRRLSQDTNGTSSVPSKKTSGDKNDSEDEIPESAIPCIRMVIVNTEDERVKLGSLYIVTCKGGTIGSKGAHEVLLPDLGCSKLHARITFQSANCTYYLRDLGSRNGTWVNGKRLSASKEESTDVPIGHKSSIQIGKSKLTCHVHPGAETCLECEPGLIKQNCQTELSVGPGREERRKQELSEIKRSYGIGVGLDEQRSEIHGFIDRAEERRRIHGVDPIGAKPETASVDQALGGRNKGFRMLEKMGWEGGGLGRENDGIQEPIRVEQRVKRSGLGSNTSPSQSETLTSKEQKKNEIWKKTQRRFSKTPVLDAFNQESEDEGEDQQS